MNTVSIGDSFENKSYELIKKSIEKDEFGIAPKYAKVFLKKGYFSQLRQKKIIFDLSIELWPPKAERFSLLYLVECKDYSSKKVPVDDIEEFLFKVGQIAKQGYFIKAVFISNNSFQEGALEIGKNAGVMLIEVTDDNEFSIKFHKARRDFNIDFNQSNEEEFESFFRNVFEISKVSGLKKWRKKDIEKLTIELLNKIDGSIIKYSKCLSVEKVIDFFKNEHELVFDFDSNVSADMSSNILGYFDPKNNLIKIDYSLFYTDRFLFLLCHEIGHFYLHRDIKINQELYNNFKDSEYDYITDKYLLSNYKNWIEWQANEFAANLMMPNISFLHRLIFIQKEIGMPRIGYVYLDDQPINRKDYWDVVEYLSKFFNTTHTSVVYKLKSMERITFAKREDGFQDNIRRRHNY